MGEPMTLERALDVAAVPPKHSRDEVFEAITLLADAHVAEKVRADKAEADVNLLRWQTQQAWAEHALVNAGVDAAIAARGLARVTAERDAALSRVAALEAAVVDADGFCRICQMGVRHGAKHTQSCALSGGTAALDAHDAALLHWVRTRVEALPTYSPGLVDGMVGMVDESDKGVGWLFRDDVLAKIAAKGGAS